MMSERSGVLIALNRRMRAVSAGRQGDRGAALITTIIFMVMLAGLSLLLLGIILGQLGPARLAQKQAETGYASQAGIQAALNVIRSIDSAVAAGKTYGDRSKLPCAFSGKVDGNASSALTYNVTVEYFTTDPTYKDLTWRAANRLPCTAASGVATQPTYALIMSRGSGPATGDYAATVGNRGIAAVYAFKVSNVNIAGGLMLTAAADGFCLRAKTATAGANPAPGNKVVFIPVSKCTVPKTDNWIYNTKVQFELASARDNGYPSGLCITQGAVKVGTYFEAVLQLCKANTDTSRWDQVFSADSGTVLQRQDYTGSAPGTIKDARSSWCLSPTAGAAENSVARITDGSCAGWANESKVGAGMASKATNQIVNYAEFGRCMDVTDQDINKAFMILWPCKQDAVGNGANLNWNHKFYYDDEPTAVGSTVKTTIRVTVKDTGKTYCLQAPATGVYPTFQTCNNKANQVWERLAEMPGGWSAGWMFINPATKECLGTRPNEFNNWVSKLALLPCNNQPDQKWNAPPFTSDSTVGGFKEISG